MLILAKALFRKHRQTPPAIVALFVQLTSFVLLGLILFVSWQVGKITFTLPEIVLSQAGLSLLMTRWFHMAWWWCVIQPLFPVAIVFMLAASLPPSIYFLLFLFLLIFYWSTFRTQVPYFPSTQKVWLAVEKLLPKNRSVSFIDIGSGLGGLILYLGRRHINSRFFGVEIAPLVWWLSHLRVKGRSKNIQFILVDYERIHLSQFDVVFAYLSPAAMPALWVKAKQEMLPGSLLISFEFAIPGIEPDRCICPATGQDSGDSDAANLYVWHM